MRGRPARQATCHPERKHLAKGFCRQCYNVEHRKTYIENGVARRDSSYRYVIKTFYGLTIEQYCKMLEIQENTCAICKRPSERRLSVDHDHGPSKHVRGLLCQYCNTGLAWFEHFREQAVTYLEKAETFDGRDI